MEASKSPIGRVPQLAQLRRRPQAPHASHLRHPPTAAITSYGGGADPYNQDWSQRRGHPRSLQAAPDAMRMEDLHVYGTWLNPPPYRPCSSLSPSPHLLSLFLSQQQTHGWRRRPHRAWPSRQPTSVSDSAQVRLASHFLPHLCALSLTSSISLTHAAADAARSDLGAQRFYRDCSRWSNNTENQEVDESMDCRNLQFREQTWSS
jgi:hypothetical protein